MAWPLDVPLERLRERRSAKWTTFDADVLPLPVAERDVLPAPPVAAVLQAALERGDTGYAGDTGGAVSARWGSRWRCCGAC